MIGLPGSGKSSVGEVLARLLGWEFLDSDAVVEADAGLSIGDLVAREGWPGFRRREQSAISAALERARVVLATGGGAVETPAVRERLLGADVVAWLQAPSTVLLKRLGPTGHGRPLLQGEPRERLASLRRRREGLYRDLATVRVDTRRDDCNRAARRILAAVRGDTG